MFVFLSSTTAERKVNVRVVQLYHVMSYALCHSNHVTFNTNSKQVPVRLVLGIGSHLQLLRDVNRNPDKKGQLILS